MILQENERLTRELTRLRDQQHTFGQQASEMQTCLNQAQADLVSTQQVLFSVYFCHVRYHVFQRTIRQLPQCLLRHKGLVLAHMQTCNKHICKKWSYKELKHAKCCAQHRETQ